MAIKKFKEVDKTPILWPEKEIVTSTHAPVTEAVYRERLEAGLWGEDIEAYKERQDFMANGAIGLGEDIYPNHPGKIDRGLAGEYSWKRLLPEDYSF